MATGQTASGLQNTVQCLLYSGHQCLEQLTICSRRIIQAEQVQEPFECSLGTHDLRHASRRRIDTRYGARQTVPTGLMAYLNSVLHK